MEGQEKDPKRMDVVTVFVSVDQNGLECLVYSQDPFTGDIAPLIAIGEESSAAVRKMAEFMCSNAKVGMKEIRFERTTETEIKPGIEGPESGFFEVVEMHKAELPEVERALKGMRPPVMDGSPGNAPSC